MSSTEAIVVAAASAFTASVGLLVMSPEADRLHCVLRHAAIVQDRKFVLYEEITGYPWAALQTAEGARAVELIAQQLADLKLEQETSGSDGAGLESLPIGEDEVPVDL